MSEITFFFFYVVLTQLTVRNETKFNNFFYLVVLCEPEINDLLKAKRGRFHQWLL